MLSLRVLAAFKLDAIFRSGPLLLCLCTGIGHAVTIMQLNYHNNTQANTNTQSCGKNAVHLEYVRSDALRCSHAIAIDVVVGEGRLN